MGYNKIPLALRYNDTTNNAEGLIEFQLNLSDVGDVCGGEPGTGQALVYHADGEWCPSTLPAPGAFNGNLSDVGQVCDNQPTEGQALVWSGSVWCPSTIPTGGGGGGDPLPTATNAGDIILADGPGTAYSASAPSDAGIMQLDPYFDANDEGAVAQWDGTKLEVVFPDQLYMLVQAGEDLSKGDVVYVSGDTGSGRFIVAKADASDPSKMPAVGLVPAAISNEGNGKIVSFGRAIGLNTAGMIVGKPVYVATTPGGITKDKPTGATELIQNIGIVSVVDGTNGVIKVTGVGRSNDIPVNVDVVGSATIGTNEFTQTSAKLSNVNQNSVMITNSVSSASSVSGASGSLVYFEGTPPAPGLQNINTILTNAGISFESPSYFLAFVSGVYSPIADEVARDIGWSLTGAGAISDPAGNVSIDGASSSVINITANGVYQIDCSLQASGPNGRVGLELDVYINTGGDGFVVSSQYQTANYATRGVGSGENIERGTCHMNTLMSLNNGDSLQFWFNPRLGGTSIIPSNGTYLRITKVG